MKKNLLILFCVSFATVLLASPCHAWLVYHKPAFKGKVIDATTKKPIEGAVVVVVYEKIEAGLGPGWSAFPFDARETLTDKDGVFQVSSYTTVIHPFSFNSHVNFIIFKPGYGQFHPINMAESTLFGSDRLEHFFSEDFGKEKELYLYDVLRDREDNEHGRPTSGRLYKTFFGVVELPKLNTWEERRNAMPSLGGDFPPEKIRELRKAEYLEELELGLVTVKFPSNIDLFLAIRDNDYEQVQRLIVNVADEIKYTMLMYAAQRGRSEMAAILIKSGAYIDAQNAMGQTPLTIALHFSQRSTAILLINKNANVNIAEKFGATPLSIACGEGYFDIVELLLRKGASVSVRGDNGRAVLAITKRVAKGSESDRMIKLLRSYGARD
jgi:ankyrin repeat protein